MPVVAFRALGVDPSLYLVASPEQFSSDTEWFWDFAKLIPSVKGPHGDAAEFGGVGGWEKNTRYIGHEMVAFTEKSGKV